jgi:hypothetical protein
MRYGQIKTEKIYWSITEVEKITGHQAPYPPVLGKSNSISASYPKTGPATAHTENRK